VSAARVTGIVLAGGRSIRFGGDKLAAEIRGRPLLHLAIEAVAGVVDEVVVVVGAAAPAPLLPIGLLVPVVVARDAVAGRGPLAGLVTGLASASHSFALLAGGDQPTLRPALLQELLRHLDAGTDGAAFDVVGLEEDGQLRPLPVALRVATARPVADVALASGTRSLVGLFGRLRVERLTPAEWRAIDPRGDSLLDVDTRDDRPPA